jgi:MFS family permease
MTLTPMQRILSLAAVIAAAFGVGVSFGIGFPLTALTLENWQQPKWVIGLGGAVPAIAVLLVLPYLPKLAGRVGPVAAIASGCLLAGVGFLALSAVSTVAAWIAIRFVMSAGIALPWLVGETWINTVSTEGIRGRVIALYAIAFFSGFSSGPMLLDWLGDDGLAPFMAGAVGAALAGVPIILARRLAPDLTHDNPKNMFAAVRLAPVGVMCGFIGGFAEISYLSLLPNVAIASHVSESQALWLLSLLTVGGGMLQFPVGWLADKADKVLVCSVLAVLFVVLSLLLPWGIKLPGVAPVMVFFMGGIILGFYTLGLSIVGDQVPGKDLAAANAAFLVMYQMGAILGPLAAGAAMSIAPVEGFIVVVAGLMVVSVIVLLMLARRTRGQPRA